ncbi:hypothetical protein WICMUC_001038 [Wickerhamomyces mucosus]|uniref:Uncharacterized protein n=1 Tax=Wickerhamomyces mucosus TaxID=1378264 RepID=A0A9P8PWB8_9ASCO|nr:hypothetical protein WICMUC_001038 [Wickerhamomyces mucosus]
MNFFKLFPSELIQKVVNQLLNDKQTIFVLSSIQPFKPFLTDYVMILKLNYIYDFSPIFNKDLIGFIDKQENINSHYFTDTVFTITQETVKVLEKNNNNDDKNNNNNNRRNQTYNTSVMISEPKSDKTGEIITFAQLNDLIANFKVVILQVQICTPQYQYWPRSIKSVSRDTLSYPIVRAYESPLDFTTKYNKDLQELEITLLSKRYIQYIPNDIRESILIEQIDISMEYRTKFEEIDAWKPDSTGHILYPLDKLYYFPKKQSKNNLNLKYSDFLKRLKEIEFKYRKMQQELVCDHYVLQKFKRKNINPYNYRVRDMCYIAFQYEFFNNVYYKWQCFGAFVENIMMEFDGEFIKSLRIKGLYNEETDRFECLDNVWRTRIEYLKYLRNKLRLNPDLSMNCEEDLRWQNI